MDHDANVIAAAALALADRIRSAAEATAGRAGGAAAALTALHGWADGEPIDALAAGLGVSHSRTVRILDGLAADGLVRREPHPVDARRVLVRLTSAGRRLARRILAAREAALADAIAVLDGGQRAALAELSEVLVAHAVGSRIQARVVCRFCDTRACGHASGRCPATRRADALG
jgi:DNA-binding MarR family transcriptional regulator